MNYFCTYKFIRLFVQDSLTEEKDRWEVVSDYMLSFSYSRFSHIYEGKIDLCWFCSVQIMYIFI